MFRCLARGDSCTFSNIAWTFVSPTVQGTVGVNNFVRIAECILRRRSTMSPANHGESINDVYTRPSGVAYQFKEKCAFYELLNDDVILKK